MNLQEQKALNDKLAKLERAVDALIRENADLHMELDAIKGRKTLHLKNKDLSRRALL